MSRVCQSQMKKLLDLLSEDGVLVNGRVTYSNTNKQSFWKHVAVQLNAVDGGVHKNTWKWCKMWSDWKNKTKKKANIVLRRKSYSFEHPSPTLTNLELRLLRLINYPMDDKADMLQLQMVNKNEAPDLPTQEMPAEYLVEDYELSDKGKMSSDDEDTAEFFNDSKEDEQLFEGLESEESIDLERKHSKGRKSKKKKLSIDEYKIKAKVALDKERALQKREELRLRAVELKLKGEELRLKEIEMNKVNYLTNIEEEKLKCFREISSSLKESDSECKPVSQVTYSRKEKDGKYSTATPPPAPTAVKRYYNLLALSRNFEEEGDKDVRYNMQTPPFEYKGTIMIYDANLGEGEN